MMYAIIAAALVVIWTLCKITDHLRSINNHLEGHGEFSRVREIQLSIQSIQRDVERLRRRFPDELDYWAEEEEE